MYQALEEYKVVSTVHIRKRNVSCPFESCLLTFHWPRLTGPRTGFIMMTLYPNGCTALVDLSPSGLPEHRCTGIIIFIHADMSSIIYTYIWQTWTRFPLNNRSIFWLTDTKIIYLSRFAFVKCPRCRKKLSHFTKLHTAYLCRRDKTDRVWRHSAYFIYNIYSLT